MISLIEKHLKSAKEAMKDTNTPIKYRKIAEKEAIELQAELSTIYTMYSKIRRYEEKICKKFEIETFES